jgi:hypothetical protein
VRTRNHLEDYSIDCWIIFQLIFSKQVGGVDWTDLAESRNRWRSVMNNVSKRRLLTRRFDTWSEEFSRLSEGLRTSI